VRVIIADYTRTSIIFGFLSLLMMVMSLIAAFYTFKNSRYVYKRLAAALYFITGQYNPLSLIAHSLITMNCQLLAACILVVLEVVVTTVRYEKLNVPFNHPPNSHEYYGKLTTTLVYHVCLS
jgi:hypothetical protein